MRTLRHRQGRGTITFAANNPDTTRGSGSAVFTAANGDTVLTELEGEFDTRTGHGAGTLTVTGGTGRSRDATGLADLEILNQDTGGNFGHRSDGVIFSVGRE